MSTKTKAMKKIGLIVGAACIAVSAYAASINVPLKISEGSYSGLDQDTVTKPDTTKTPRVPIPPGPDTLPKPTPPPLPEPQMPKPNPKPTVPAPTPMPDEGPTR